MKKLIFILVLAMLITMTACGAKGEETTLSGMIVSVEGTVISLVEMDGSMGDMEFAEGERPQMPESMEGFEGFNPGNMPEGSAPENMPEGMTPPEGMPEFDGEKGERPEFGREEGNIPDFGNFASDAETKTVDIANAHISVEIENGKESGSMDNIVPGAFVTVTVNSKGEATYVLVSARSGSGGRRNPSAE